MIGAWQTADATAAADNKKGTVVNTMSDTFGPLNSIGEVETTGRNMGGEYGGNDSTGPIGNVLPTGIVARGANINSSGADMSKGMRSGMSTSRNSMKGRMSNR